MDARTMPLALLDCVRRVHRQSKRLRVFDDQLASPAVSVHKNSLYIMVSIPCSLDTHYFMVHMTISYMHAICSMYTHHIWCTMTMTHFGVTIQFVKRGSKYPKITLACSRSKGPICMLHLPPEPTLSSALLGFELWPNFGKSPPNDTNMTLTWSKSKVHICILHTSLGTKISSVSLCDEPF